jgi:hypothetical protein
MDLRCNYQQCPIKCDLYDETRLHYNYIIGTPYTEADGCKYATYSQTKLETAAASDPEQDQ